MWINHLTTYELEFAHPESWAEKLAEHAVGNPAIGQRKAIGFLPTNDAGAFVDRIEHHFAILGAVAERHLPNDAIEREVRRRFGQQEEAQAKASWLQVEQDMLTTAAIREKSVPAVYDAESQRLYVFASAKLAEDVILAGLKEALGSVHAVPVTPKDAIEPKLTMWLKEGKAPLPFYLGRMAELEAEAETGGKTVFKGQDLSDAKVQQHLEDGDFVSVLQLNWRGELEFSVNARGEIKKIAPPDCKMKAQHIFNIWPDVMDKLPRFFNDVMELMGGSKDLGNLVEVQERERAPAPEAEPSGPAVRVAIIAVGAETDVPIVRQGLDHLVTKRRLSEILLPDIGNPVMRMASDWAKEKKVPLRLVQMQGGTTEDRMIKVFSFTPNGIVMYGKSPEADEYVSMARERKVGVMRLG